MIKIELHIMSNQKGKGGNFIYGHVIQILAPVWEKKYIKET